MPREAVPWGHPRVHREEHEPGKPGKPGRAAPASRWPAPSRCNVLLLGLAWLSLGASQAGPLTPVSNCPQSTAEAAAPAHDPRVAAAGAGSRPQRPPPLQPRGPDPAPPPPHARPDPAVPAPAPPSVSPTVAASRGGRGLFLSLTPLQCARVGTETWGGFRRQEGPSHSDAVCWARRRNGLSEALRASDAGEDSAEGDRWRAKHRGGRSSWGRGGPGARAAAARCPRP